MSLEVFLNQVFNLCVTAPPAFIHEIHSFLASSSTAEKLVIFLQYFKEAQFIKIDELLR